MDADRDSKGPSGAFYGVIFALLTLVCGCGWGALALLKIGGG